MKTYNFLNDLHFSVDVPEEKAARFRELVATKLQKVVYSNDDIDIVEDEPLNNITSFDIFATISTNLTTDFLDDMQQLLVEYAIENYYN